MCENIATKFRNKGFWKERPLCKSQKVSRNNVRLMPLILELGVEGSALLADAPLHVFTPFILPLRKRTWMLLEGLLGNAQSDKGKQWAKQPKKHDSAGFMVMAR